MGNWLGKRRFNRCPHKKITIQPYYKAKSDSGNSWSSKQPKSGSYNLMNAAKLECPRTRKNDQDVSSHVWESKHEAIEDLTLIASRALCTTCRLSSKSPQQIEEDEATELDARAKRIEAQNRLKKAEREQEELRKLGESEVQAINSQYGIDPT